MPVGQGTEGLKIRIGISGLINTGFLCAENAADQFSELMLRQTTAFGVRRTVYERRKLRREMAQVKTRFGNVAVKIGRLNGRVVQASPEYESCRALADQKREPVLVIYREAQAAAREFST